MLRTRPGWSASSFSWLNVSWSLWPQVWFCRLVLVALLIDILWFKREGLFRASSMALHWRHRAFLLLPFRWKNWVLLCDWLLLPIKKSGRKFRSLQGVNWNFRQICYWLRIGVFDPVNPDCPWVIGALSFWIWLIPLNTRRLMDLLQSSAM